MARESKQALPLTDEDLMPFGKHKGEKMENVPAKYLLYMYENGMLSNNTRVWDYVDKNIDIIKQQAQNE